MNIIAASKATQKIDAIRDALSAVGIDSPTIISVSAPSGINSQPVGDSETTLGAENRLAAILTEEPAADLYISTENGIRSDGHGNWFDFAVVIVCRQGGDRVITHSMGIKLPTTAVEEAQQRGFDQVTVGKVLAERGIVSNHQDPHAELTNGAFPRRKILALAIEMALAQLPPLG